MHPILFKIGDAIFYSYGVFLALGLIIPLWFIEKKAKREGIDPRNVLDLGLLVMISGILGARIYHVVLIDPSYYLDHPLDIVNFKKGGLVSYGFLIAAIFMGIWYLRQRKIPVLKFSDICGVFLPLGQAIVRMGCFLHGCCFGKVTDVAWSVNFPRWISLTGEIKGSFVYSKHLEMMLIDSSTPWSLPVHPTQLYAIGYNLIIFLLLLIIAKKKRFEGQVLASYLILYPFARFIQEFYRGDNERILLGVTSQQFFSILVFISGIYLFIKLKRKKV